MPRSSTFVAAARRIEALIDAHAQSGSGRHGRAVSLRRALLSTIARWDVNRPQVAEGLRNLSFAWGKFAKRHSDRIDRLATVMYMVSRCGFSKVRATSLLAVPGRDVDYILGLLKRAERSIESLAVDLDGNVLVKSAVDGYLENLVVSLDERALEDMLLAAVESYEARSGNKGEKYKECYGWCLGYETRSPPRGNKKRLDMTLRITRVVTQIRANAGAGYVIPNDSSARAHRRVAERFFPHLQLVGDYHTHPFGTIKQLQRDRGWEHSSGDRRQIAEWIKGVRLDGSNPRFSLIVAVAKGEKSGRQMTRLADNRWKIGMSNLHLVIAAYRILHDGSYDRQVKLKLSYLDGGAG